MWNRDSIKDTRRASSLVLLPEGVRARSEVTSSPSLAAGKKTRGVGVGEGTFGRASIVRLGPVNASGSSASSKSSAGAEHAHPIATRGERVPPRVR